MTDKPQAQRRACVVCEVKFTAKRKDARYCSGKCRQRAARARPLQDELLLQITETRRLYWRLIQQYAEAKGVHQANVLTELSPTVTRDGEVWIRGKHVGWARPHREGWDAWGLEAAPPPFMPPTTYADQTFGVTAIDKAVRQLARTPARCQCSTEAVTGK